MINDRVDIIIASIDDQKHILSNAGTRPLVSAIIQRAQNIVDFLNDSGFAPDGDGLIAIATPSTELSSQYFKGWKAEDFERLAIELENLKT